MKSIYVLLVSLLTVSSCLTPVWSVQEAFTAGVYQASGGHALNYRIHTPAKLDPQLRYPLVIFFHGAGERGSDNAKQLVHGVRDILRYAARTDNPTIIIAPQCPRGSQWVDTPWSDPAHSMPEKPSLPMRLAIELLEKTIREKPVDAKRVYVSGLSMGGFGTWDLMQRRPMLFAAAIPVCGGGDPHYARSLAAMPIWVFHGSKDTVVKPMRSRDMIAALKQAGGEPRYTEYKGVGHNAWTETYSNEKVLKWMFEQKREEKQNN
jgi:predicted peptidase